jgi:ADP-heptose:LPS heptosyltransferase
MKVLIIRFSSIGDIVLTTPVVRAVKTQLQHAEVHYCTKKNFASILTPNPYIDKVHVLEDSLDELIKKLREEKYDYVIDLHHNLRTLIIKWRLGVPSGSFDKLNFKKWLLVNLKINTLPKIHIVDRYLAAAAKLGVHDDGKGLDYFIPEKEIVTASMLPKGFEQGYASVAIGAQHYTKRLPTHKLIELCKTIQQPIILMGGKEDKSVGDSLADSLQKQGKLAYNGCGAFSLHQSASVLQQAQVVYSHDTGLMHIAAAFQKEIYSIWGNTVPAFGMYPYRTVFHVIENKNLSCRPCSKIGHASCPKGHFKCMEELVF